MTVYYNENDPAMAAWLRELIKQGHIANGEVDERSIEDVPPRDLCKYTQLHFFAGIGGWPWHCWEVDPRRAYKTLWDKINGDLAWELNPFVWVVSYELIKRNINE